MPGFDGTGPMGMGPLTGGGRGYCVYPAGGGTVYGIGRGGMPWGGRGRAWGRGLARGSWRRGSIAPLPLSQGYREAYAPQQAQPAPQDILQRLDELQAENAQLRSAVEELLAGGADAQSGGKDAKP